MNIITNNPDIATTCRITDAPTSLIMGMALATALNPNIQAIATKVSSCLSQKLVGWATQSISAGANSSAIEGIAECGGESLRRVNLRDFDIDRLEEVCKRVLNEGDKSLEMRVAQGEIYGVGHVGLEFTVFDHATNRRTSLFTMGHYPESSSDFLKFYKKSKGTIRLDDPILKKGSKSLKSYTLSKREVGKIFAHLKESENNQYNLFGWGAPNCRDFADGIIRSISQEKLNCLRWCKVK